MGLMPPTTPRIKLIILSELAAGMTWIKPSSSAQNFCWAMEVLSNVASCAGTLTGFLTLSCPRALFVTVLSHSTRVTWSSKSPLESQKVSPHNPVGGCRQAPHEGPSAP